MANCHTIIGAKRFHFRVRDGIGWFTLAMVTKQTGVASGYFICLSTVFAVRLNTTLEICNTFLVSFISTNFLLLFLCSFLQ